MGHGFARIIYANTMKCFTGYYKYGNKLGKGIQLKPEPYEDTDGTTSFRVKVQAEGIWKGNQTIAKFDKIESFSENALPCSNINDADLIYVPQEGRERHPAEAEIARLDR